MSNSRALQLLDELRLLTGDVTEQSVFSPFPSNLFTADSSSFDEHLKSRSAAIETTIRDIFSKAQNHKPEVVDFQERIAKLLLSEKEHIHKLQVAQSEYDDMQDRLSKATSRYLKAEKGIDRAKSRTVQKLERQAISGGRSETGSGLGGGADVKSESTNGQVNSEALVQAEIARKQTEAVAAKQQEQLQQLSTRNQELINQVAELKLKSSNNLDDQYAQTELFKQSKKQLEDSVNRINNLEATNADLRKEAKRLQAERAAYRTEVDAELNSSNAEKDMQLSKAESDLARIRTARDELYAELQVRKQAQDQEKTSVEHIKQIAAAKDDRILSLESEIERLRGVQEDDHASIADLPLEELQTKYAALEKQYSMMNQELAAMSSAYKKLSSNVSQKVTNLSDLEEKVARSTAEKSKADQKYFGAMKAKDAREQEVRTLRTQNSKTAEIVTQFKDVEAGHRELVVTLEKQVAESKDAFAILEAKHHVVQSQVSEKSSAVEVSRKQLDDAKAVMQERTKEAATVSDALRKAETEIEKLKVDIAEKDSRLETWRQTNTDTDEGKIVEALRVSWRLHQVSNSMDLTTL